MKRTLIIGLPLALVLLLLWFSKLPHQPSSVVGDRQPSKPQSISISHTTASKSEFESKADLQQNKIQFGHADQGATRTKDETSVGVVTSDTNDESAIETEARDIASKLKSMSKRELVALLSADLARVKSNKPPSVTEMKALVSELEKRFPDNKDLQILVQSMDVDNMFGREPEKLLESSRRLFEENPGNPDASSLLVYGMLAQGFDKFSAQIPDMVARYPQNPAFQYGAAAVDLANGDNEKAIERLRYIQATNPGFKKAAETLRKIKERRTDSPIGVDDVMDFNPTAPEKPVNYL